MAVGLSADITQQPRRTPSGRPNVVILLADDLGWKDIGCYGGPVRTPTLDRLAAEGARFTDFYAGAAVCGPSRAVLLTGRHHARTGIYGNVIFDAFQKPHLLEREITLPKVLKRYGYATAHFGKWHLGMPTRDVKKPTPAEHGFDYWFGMNSGASPSHKDPVNFLRNGKRVGKIEGYSCQILVDEAISWLDQERDPNTPFFLNLWFHEPHDPIAAPDSIVSQYGDLNDQAAVYSGTIENTDRAIARLLNKLKEVDSLENALVFYTSDNGSYRDDRNGNLRGRKGKSFEGGIRVPGIFYWPGTIKQGQVEREPAGVVDLLPTICGLLGIDKPDGVHLDGTDISPLLTSRDNGFARHQPLYWHLPSGNPSLAIRDGNYSMVAYRDYEFPRDREAIVQVEKEIEEVLRKANSPELIPWVERTDYFYKKFKNKDAERLRGKFMRLNVFQDSWIPVLKSGSYKRFQLFDLASDPRQKVDVSKQHPEVFARLKRQLLEINASVMAEAPDWGSADGTPTPPSPNPDTSKTLNSPNAELLARIDKGNSPKAYSPSKHQDYVDRRMAGLSQAQRARIGRLWKEKQRIDPDMPNRGESFVRIMEYVARDGRPEKKLERPNSAVKPVLRRLPSADSGRLPDVSGIKGGLVVVLGCDNPSLLADWVGAGPYVVHGLDEDSGKVEAARQYLLQKERYGPVTVSGLRNAQLPYVDSLVNLLVVTGSTRVPENEMLRALAPGGVIADLRKPGTEMIRKAWPPEIDEWSHYLYDASNNAVSKDVQVAPPQGLRWTCGPRYARSHEHFSSMSAMVTAGGRIFYIIDEGPISSVYLAPQWKLVARDAFSGVRLWEKPVTNWESHLRGFRSGPPEIGRRMVAAGDRLYVTLGYGEPVSVLDAATGKRISTLADTRGARELLLTDGVLVVLADDMTTSQHNDRREQITRHILKSDPKRLIWSRLPRGAFPIYGIPRIVAVHTGTGKSLWNQAFKEPGEIAPATLAVDDGKICVQTLSHVVCLDAAKGTELWREEHPIATSRFSWSTPTLVIHDGVVLTVDRKADDQVGKSPPISGSAWFMSSGNSQQKQEGELVAFALDDGKELWRAPCEENYNTPLDLFVIDGVVWVGDLRHGDDTGFTQGRDLKTGKVVATIPPQKAYGHHRCYRNKATARWFMVGRGGIQFIDHRTGRTRNAGVARGTCQYGVMPANGLIYVPHHSCACNPDGLMTGLNVFSARSSAGEGLPPLEKGPAYGESLKPGSSTGGWPTYRGDVRRSGCRNLPAPVRPGVAWTREFSAPVTAPTAADGLVFVAERERHTLRALSAVTGEPVWTFTADGRIDSPPTLFKGRCLFGTRNGFVYCLRASDGALAWRFRAAARDRRLFAYGQLESVWPVHGSVLVDDQLSGGAATVYFAAGRSSQVDGGIRLYALELETGRLFRETDVTTSPDRRNAGAIRKTALPDILSIQHDAIWMRGLGVDGKLAPVKKASHLFAPRGFLDDTWWHRTYWVYGTEIGGGYTHWPSVGNRVPAGRLLTFDGGELIYGYGRMAYRAGDGHVRSDMTRDYKLFAEFLEPAPVATPGEERKRRIKWTAQLPFVARAMVLARDALLVAGGASPTETAERHGPGAFWVASREDGSKQAACTLLAPPVLDGMAMVDSGILISTTDGSVVCLRTKDAE